MANDSLQTLANTLAQDAAKGPVTLNATYIEACGITVPAGFDTALKAAWRLAPGDAGLQLTFQPSDVGTVQGERFQVKNAQITQGFLGATATQTGVTMTFSLPSEPIQVQIEAKLTGWTFQSFFTFWTGWLFSQITFATPTFIFTTLDTGYSWNSNAITLTKGQNFAAMANLPASLQPILSLLQGLGVVNPPFAIFGPIAVDKANNETILYPDIDINAVLSTGQVDLFYLKAYRPSFGLRIQTEDGQLDDGTPDYAPLLGDTQPIQTPSLYVGLKIDVPNVNGKTIQINFEARSQQTGNGYSFSIMIDPDSPEQLTPAAVIQLMAGSSYFQDVPPPLQQFLANVGLKGFTVSGPLSPAGISSIGAYLGSVGNTELVLFEDPSNGQKFAIKSFDLEWTIISPFDSELRESLVSFTTVFILWPQVFKNTDGTPGGEFVISIDQDFNVDGGFYGQVSMDDLLREVTKGAVGMPSGVEVSFNDVTFSLSPTAKSYAFGFGFDASLDFVTWNGQPLLQFQGMRFDLAASTPTTSGGVQKTVYRGTISGVVGVGPIMVNTFVQYDGTVTPSVWTLQTSLAQPLSLSDLVNQLFRSVGDTYSFPAFLPGDLTVETFSIDATVPTRSTNPPPTPQPTYKVAGKVLWEYDGLPIKIKTTADLGLQYDGNKPTGQQFSGSVIGTIAATFPYATSTVTLELMIGYQFGPATLDPPGTGQGTSVNTTTLWVQWEGIRGTYDFGKNTITFTLNGWTVGSLLQSLVRLIGDPYFTLDSPWDILNQISLNGLYITFDLNQGVVNRVKAGYTLPSPIDFGFMKITGLTFQLVDGKVTIAIAGTSTIPGMQNSPLFNPNGTGQNVQNMPPVPGQGNELFDLRLLAMGQRIGIVDSGTFDSTQALIKALEGVPSTTGKTNPVNPGSTQKGQPYYNAANNWMVGLDFGLLRVGTVYTFDCMVAFNDPNIYGLRLQFNGEKAKVLAGLVIDILYKKITDDIGLYQIDFSFPSILRNLDFGAFSIVLPEIRIQIYTNGDFFFDFGFPYNLNFARSFTVQAIVYGVPVLGSAGFYFGKLSNATATGLPQTTCGTFDPVIVFGFGAQLGVGRYFEKGPLKAGFSITVFGIIQGMFAAWNPYAASGAPASSSSVQGNYYFKLQGSFGVIGKLYGTVDFAIIKANVELLVQVMVQITYESFKPIPLSISAHVSVKVSLKIDLGLFSISISFSFATTISADLTIGGPGNAPWDCKSTSQLELRRMQRIAPVPQPSLLKASGPRFKTIVRGTNDSLPSITLVPAPQFTVQLPNIESTALADQKGAFIFLMAMDAPTADGSGNAGGSSFQSLCEGLLPWVIDSFTTHTTDQVDLSTLAETPVTKQHLQDIVDALANNDNPPINYGDIVTFLKSGFTINVVEPSAVGNSGATGDIKLGATIFPPFTGFSLKVPDPDGGTDPVTIAFDSYTAISGTYRAAMTKMFNELAARVQDQSGNQPVLMSTDTTPEQLMQFLFEDYFVLVSRQLVQAAADAMDDYLYTLQDGDSLQDVFNWAQDRGNAHLQYGDIATPNLEHALSGGRGLSLQGLTYTIQQGNSLQAVADRYSDPAAGNKRWVTTPADLILINHQLSTAIASGVELTMTVSGNEVKYVTKPGDSFDTIATNTGQTIEQLSAQTGIYGVATLLVPSVAVMIPTIAYTTAAGDTLQSIMTAFAISLDTIIDVPANQQEKNLFDRTVPTISIANLDTLYISDLWKAILLGDQVAQTAGMAARFPLYGVRLPNLDGLTLPPKFLYPAGQSSYGVYQLSGQQFPTPTLAQGASYGITLEKNGDLDWIEFAGSTGTGSLPLDLTKQAGQLGIVLEYAVKYGYTPVPTLAVQPDVKLTAKRFSVRSSTLWSTSDQTELVAITAPPAMLETAVASSGSGAQPQPVLWEMPDTLLREIETRQAALGAEFDVAQSVPYLPVLLPEIGTTDPATRATTFTAAENYAFATRIDFKVKRLAQDDDPTPQNPFANDVIPPDHGNAGSQARPLAPYNYELIGPGPSDAVLLQRLLTAMDSLGQDIISGIFILYPDNAAAPNGLVSRANSEFLSFITQTNLSTETNPPTMMKAGLSVGDGQPRGIANTPGEFVKIMWELSTVRSGGYYLYYEMVGQDTGLPDSLFDDTGTATLTLVIAYDRKNEPANGGILFNYTNAFVTTDPIDMNRSVMTLESQSSQADTAALAGTETLDDIAALYGSNIGTLVSLNTTKPIVAGKQIPISGAIRQVTQADLTQGNVLASYATYYSAGAAQPITATDIANYNPGVQVALTSVFRIPPVTYVVGSGTGPGNTFGSMAQYYGLQLDALADLARSVAGIFAAGTVLVTDSEDFDVQPTLGTGNVGVDLTRDNLGTPPDLPANPTQQQKDDFAKAYLYSLYQLLTAGIEENAFFTASDPGLSFGPQKQLDPEEAQALRRAHTRRALLSAQQDEPFEYSQGLGYGTFSTVNPAPDPATSGLPPKSANPYIGVGTFAQVDLDWVDLFGNRTVTPFNAPSSSYNGPLNNPPALIDYIDRLVGLEQWPNVRACYTYAGSAGSPQLQMMFTLNTAAYEPTSGDTKACQNPVVNEDDIPQWQRNALNDLKIFTRIYFQLNQNYDSLNIPGLSGNAVSMAVSNSILENPLLPLNDTQASSVRQFVAACVEYTNNRAHCQAGGTAPTMTLPFDIALADVSTENIIQLDVEFMLTRQAALSDPALRVLPDGLSTSTTIRPLMDDPAEAGTIPPVTDDNEPLPPPQDLGAFADALEAVFVNNDWQMRVGTGAALPDQPRTSETFSVWAVRMGKTPGVGLTYDIGSEASFYAPQPVATELMTDTVQLYQYTTGSPYPSGETVPVTFTGVDMNVWADTALTAIDNFLTASFSSPAYIIDNLFFSDPEKEGYVARILKHKETLANAIASTVRPILETSATDDATKAAAEEKLRQALLNRLSNAFIVTAVTVLPVTDATTNEEQEPGTVSPPRFFGQPQGAEPTGDSLQALLAMQGAVTPEQNYSFSSGKIPLTPKGKGGDTRLAFLFSSKNVTQQPYVALDLSYALTHLEFNIRNVPGIENYEQSSWLTFVNGPFTTPISPEIGGKQVPTNLPVVLRALPAPPTVTTQTADAIHVDAQGVPVVEPGETPSDLAKWIYGFQYVYLGSAQDSATATVEFNLAQALMSMEVDPTKQLFDALAQFITVYPKIAQDFDTYLRVVNANSKPADVTNAKEAVAAFEKISDGVAAAYKLWADAQVGLAMMVAPSQVTFVFDVVLSDDNGDARIDIYQISLEPAATVLPKPVLLIEPETYEATEVTPPAGALVSYKYKLRTSSGDSDPYLPYGDALANPTRNVGLGPVSLFGFQNAWSGVQIVRNKFLVPGVATTDWFKFSTPEVKFAEPIVPLLQYDDYDLGSVLTGNATLDAFLNAFFESLLGDAIGQQVEVKMSAAYSYMLVPSITSLPYTTLPIVLMPATATTPETGVPPAFVAPFSAAVNTWLLGTGPVLNSSSKLVFDLTIFAGLTSDPQQQQPLLTIRSLTLDANRVVLPG